ncbi:hypothetical protein CSA37_13160 [Candidatus Fermentibacteria bacterium]|nr:MAG: hypothetical protein CSA37_13160 [Candidatus Fermentibacteria bacterium]
MKRLLPLLILIVLAACGTETVTDTPDTDAVPDPYADPPGYTENPFAGYGPVTSISLPAGNGEVAAASSASHGNWSVQIAACGTMEAASSLQNQVSALTDEPVFIDRIGSYFKVRVGAFSTAESSSSLRALLRSNGYPDAWSVERETAP